MKGNQRGGNQISAIRWYHSIYRSLYLPSFPPWMTFNSEKPEEFQSNMCGRQTEMKDNSNSNNERLHRWSQTSMTRIQIGKHTVCRRKCRPKPCTSAFLRQSSLAVSCNHLWKLLHDRNQEVRKKNTLLPAVRFYFWTRSEKDDNLRDSRHLDHSAPLCVWARLFFSHILDSCSSSFFFFFLIFNSSCPF